MEKIKYILWDIDGTLIDFNYAEKEGLKLCFEKYGLGKLAEEMLKKYKEINHEYWKQFERGEISKKETMERRFIDLFNLYGFDTSIVERFNEDYQINMGDVARFNPNGKDVVTRLKGKYKQYAATNGTVEAQNRKLSKSGLNNMLDGIFISEEIGFDKPSTEFFQEMFKRVGSNNLEEYIIIGDSLTSDILGGKRVGIRTCWYNPSMNNNNYDYSPDYEIHDLSEILDLLQVKKEKNKGITLSKHK